MEATLKDRLTALREPIKKPCPVAKLFDQLDAETAEALTGALYGPVSTLRLYQELQRSGISIGRDALSVHRKGQCVCAVKA